MTRGARIACELSDIKDRVILLHGFSEYSIARFVERFVEEDWVCADAGANSGEYTLLLSDAAPRGTVYAFEPAAPIFRKLAANVERNRLPETVLENAALNSFDGTCTFYVNLTAGNDGLSSLSLPQSDGYSIREERVRCVALDTYFASSSRLDFLKLDVEGHEMDVLRGGRQTLSRLSPALIFEFGALHRLPDNGIFEFLHDAGYTVFCVDYNVDRGPRLVECDVPSREGLARFYKSTEPINLFAAHERARSSWVKNFITD